MVRLRKTIVALTLLAGIGAAPPLHTGYGERLAAPADAASFLPRFEVGTRRGRLILDGHTVSAAHEAALTETAARRYPDMAIETRFRPLGMAPDWWRNATVALVASLSGLRGADATLTQESLRVRGIADDDTPAGRRLQALDSVLPASVSQHVGLAVYDGDIDASDVCERHFAAFRHGPVGFEESGAELLSSAYPVLERVVALADACRDGVISIIGHTDASGSEAWNRQLSLERARAVATFLAERGIDTPRMRVAGEGSSRPIADNATRHGRSLNRRIEIRFSTDR